MKKIHPYLKKLLEEISFSGKSLDMGCGTGSDVFHMRKMGWQAYGVDKVLPTEDYFFQEFDLENDFSHPKAPFDLVISLYVLQFIENRIFFLRSCYNNLKIGGRFFLITFEGPDESFDDWVKLFSFKSLEELIISAGFKKTEIIKKTCVHPPHGTCSFEHTHKLLVVEAIKD